ncbi:MAG: autotransporter outer membrane beta-barrel domain-containing protein [Candidatus Omnitrophota bacterium]
MKKILVSILVLFYMFASSGLVFAASIGSTIPNAEQEGIGLSIGVEDNFIFERKIEKNGNITGGKVENSNETYAMAILQPVNFMTIYGKVGAANLEEEFNWDINRDQKIKFDYGVVAGGGVNLIYNFGNNFGIGWDNQATWSHNEADSISGDNSPRLTSKGSVNNLNGRSTIYAKYDFNLQESGILTPYLGCSYLFARSDIDKDIQVTDDTNIVYTYGDAENKDNFGVVAGLNYKVGKNLSLGLEGRFIAETAITGNVSYKF